MIGKWFLPLPFIFANKNYTLTLYPYLMQLDAALGILLTGIGAAMTVDIMLIPNLLVMAL